MNTFKNEMKQIKWPKLRNVTKQTLYITLVILLIATTFTFFDAGIQYLISLIV